MKITAIKQQVKRSDRYSIYVDEAYAFSLSERALIEHGLASGQQLDAAQLAAFKQLSADDKLYQQTLRYIAMRMRSSGEVAEYLRRKKAAPSFIDQTIQKMTDIGLLDDLKYARAFVADRRSLRAQSRRKISAELRKHYIEPELINVALTDEEGGDERQAIRDMIQKKRRQSKYQDLTKLMQYLARQGFSYGDIQDALAELAENED